MLNKRRKYVTLSLKEYYEIVRFNHHVINLRFIASKSAAFNSHPIRK